MEDNEIICIIVIVVGVVSIYVISKHFYKLKMDHHKETIQEGFDGTSAPTNDSCDGSDSHKQVWVESCQTTLSKKEENVGLLCDLYDDAGVKLINLLASVAKNDKNPDSCASYNTENTHSWIQAARNLMDVRKACDKAVDAYNSEFKGCSGNGGCLNDESNKSTHKMLQS